MAFKCKIEGFSPFQSVIAHDLGYSGPFPLQVALMKKSHLKTKITEPSDDFWI